MNLTQRIFLPLIFVLFLLAESNAQNRLSLDYSQLMEIPGVVAMNASTSHLYVLSENEGMAVFRVYPDSFQWLYTSAGMQRRGTKIMADVRFAYLFGNSRRLTVLEPTSALGVYSSAVLPVTPNSVARIDNTLYLVLGDKGLGFLSLESPESVDAEIQYAAKNEIGDNRVLDVRASEISRQLFVLLDNSSLLIFDDVDGELRNPTSVNLNSRAQHLFIVDEQIWGSTSSGDVFEVNDNGIGNKAGSVNEEVSEILNWNEALFVRTVSGKIWTTFNSEKLQPWKSDNQAGNQIANANNRLWLAENNKIAEVRSPALSSEGKAPASGSFRIKNIPKQIITFPNPFVLAFELEGNSSTSDVEFSYRSNVKNAEIRKQGFYWQPTVNQVGMHWFNIIATNSKGESDSTRFTVDVRSFNAPPRFAPVRVTSIAVNEKYSLQLKAIDPENPQSPLVRYIGVDLPEGASINEKTGTFNWTPAERQIGESTFRVIATDQLGAATSIDVTLNVLDISRGDSQ